MNAIIDSQLKKLLTKGNSNSSSGSGELQSQPKFNELIFSEFLETIASVALISEADSGMEIGKKIRLAFNTIAQLQPPTQILTNNDNNESENHK